MKSELITKIATQTVATKRYLAIHDPEPQMQPFTHKCMHHIRSVLDSMNDHRHTLLYSFNYATNTQIALNYDTNTSNMIQTLQTLLIGSAK